MNSLYQQLSGQSSQMNSLKQMLNMVRTSRDPNMVMQQLINSSPQMRQVMDVVRQNGGDPKTAFYNVAKQRGVNPEDILNMLK